jgi:hypothetical protein
MNARSSSKDDLDKEGLRSVMGVISGVGSDAAAVLGESVGRL